MAKAIGLSAVMMIKLLFFEATGTGISIESEGFGFSVIA